MKILYGVQGTGNGHLTRALAMAEAFQTIPELDVDFLLSGRARSQLFGVDTLGPYEWRAGLTFATKQGRVDWLDTLSRNPWSQFWQDVQALDLKQYDLVVTDFEPVTAWAAKRQQIPCIGLGRQYAFWRSHKDLPVSGLQRAMLRQFAPCDLAIGTHWSPLHSQVLPPLLSANTYRQSASQSHRGRHLVYLPFVSLDSIKGLLQRFPHVVFDVFHPQAKAQVTANANFYAPSRQAFQVAFERAEGVISNAGFGTASEAIMAGKKLLVCPLKGQFEQLINARCLQQMGAATVSDKLYPDDLANWLRLPAGAPVPWPNVAEQLAVWLQQVALKKAEPIAELSHRLWAPKPSHCAVA